MPNGSERSEAKSGGRPKVLPWLFLPIPSKSPERRFPPGTFDKTCFLFKVSAPERRRTEDSGAFFDRSDRRNILSVAASPSNSPVAYLETKPGQHTTEIEAPEILHDAGTQHVVERLTDLMRNHRVTVGSNKGKLIKKPTTDAE
jgi:hypothetical protein